MSLNGSKRYFSWKKAYAIIFEKFQVISSNFDKLLYFTPDFPTNQIMDWDLDKGEILKNLQKWVWMAQNDIFHEKRHTRSFLKSFKWFQAILTSYYIFTPDFPTNQIMDWDLDKGEILKTYKNEFTGLKRFFVKEGLRDHFCKVSSDLKPFWQVTIFHTRLPHKPNHGLGLRQGWNSENLKKWVWMAQNDIFHEKRHTRSFLKSFKWFQAILTSYYISHQTSPPTKIMDWDLDKGEILKTYKNEFE